MPELKALARERRLRKAELIKLIQNDQWNTNPPLQSWELDRPPQPNRPPPPPPTQTWEPIDDRGASNSGLSLTKRQLKRRRNMDSKLAKKFKSLDAEISNLKSQMEALKDNKSFQEHSLWIEEKEDKVHEKRIR